VRYTLLPAWVTLFEKVFVEFALRSKTKISEGFFAQKFGGLEKTLLRLYQRLTGKAKY